MQRALTTSAGMYGSIVVVVSDLLAFTGDFSALSGCSPLHPANSATMIAVAASAAGFIVAPESSELKINVM